MQIFEVIELTEFPYMETKEEVDGISVGDIIDDSSFDKVFLLVDHDTKRIWTYNGPQSSLKIQIYGGILAGMLRQQLRLFYRVYPLNKYSKTDKEFQELMNKQIGAGRAKIIQKEDFSGPTPDKYVVNTSIQGPNVKKALEYVEQFPPPENLSRRFMIIGAQIFTDEPITEAFVKEEKTIIKPAKLGRLNNGFTFFEDHNYSTRMIIKDRKIQGIELYVNKDDKPSSLELEIPIIYEQKFSKPGSIKSLTDAFKIPDQHPKEDEKEEEIKEDKEKIPFSQDDSLN
ncbi:MAG: hypothetical protein ACXAEX_15800 [Promethearchaeota archaeon]|jgi:hypothetical protein